jgi:L-iditol 2-dehydrogenase
MKALLLSKYRHLEIADLPSPVPAPDEVLIGVSACGICGSDVHGYDGSSGRRIPPIVMGHEAAGIVASAGADVRKVSQGDRVTFDSTVFCGVCPFCLRGEINLCDNRKVLGVSCGDYRRAGAFAEFVTVPERIVHRLPESLTFPQAAMLEAVSVALHAVSLSQVKFGQSALVLGAGMIGLLTMQALRVAGCASVYVADVDATRLKLAAQLGGTGALLATGPDLVSQILDLTKGHGVDLALEAVGINDTVSAAVNCVRKGGTVTLVGNISAEVTLPLQKVVTRQIRMQGSCASAGEYPQAMELIASGKIQVQPLITAIAPLEDGPRWFERLYSREPNLMKVVLTPNANELTS